MNATEPKPPDFYDPRPWVERCTEYNDSGISCNWTGGRLCRNGTSDSDGSLVHLPVCHTCAEERAAWPTPPDTIDGHPRYYDNRPLHDARDDMERQAIDSVGNFCGEPFDIGGYSCTRHPHEIGDHISAGSSALNARWPNDSGPTPPAKDPEPSTAEEIESLRALLATIDEVRRKCGEIAGLVGGAL